MEPRTFYLNESDFPEESYCAPDMRLEGKNLADGRVLLDSAKHVIGNKMGGYRVTSPVGSEGQNVDFRGHKVISSGKVVHVLREMPTFVPNLKHPSLNYDHGFQEILLNPGWARGGLVLISGSGGSGKSTTMAATLTSRLERFGGVAITVEDPPEYQLSGKHGDGLCMQFAAEKDGDFAARVRDALRCYPAQHKGAILLLSEIRSSEVAAIAVESAMSGHLVLATIHSMGLESAVSRLCTMASQINGETSTRHDVAESLRAVVYQRVLNARLQVETLLSSPKSTSVQAKIRDGLFHHLKAEIDRQKTLTLNGMDPLS